MDQSLCNKTIVLTGATSGIGFQAALDFAQSGAVVIGVGRDSLRCAQAREKILQRVPQAKVEFLIADLASQQQIHHLVSQINLFFDENEIKALDVLVNNAGVYMTHKVMTEEGIETTFAVNHIAPFLLTDLLTPRLNLADAGRVITVSSNSHYNTWFIPEKAKNPSLYFGLWAYKVSKLANVLFSYEFNRLHQGSSLKAYAVDPGLVNTEIGKKQAAGIDKRVWQSRQKKGVSPEIPSQTLLYLASQPAVKYSNEIYWYLCKPKKPSRIALDADLAGRLWDESCMLSHLHNERKGS